VAGKLEAELLRKVMDAVLQLLAFFERKDFIAVKAGGMVVVSGKCLAQFQFVLPADLQSVNDAEFFKQFDGAVNARAVHLVLQFADELVHTERVAIRKRVKNIAPCFCQAVALILQRMLQASGISYHAAILAKIATNLQ
jgi:hypothetical protein